MLQLSITEGCYVGSSRNMCMLAASSVWAGWTGLSAQFVLHSDDLRGDWRTFKFASICWTFKFASICFVSL